MKLLINNMQKLKYMSLFLKNNDDLLRHVSQCVKHAYFNRISYGKKCLINHMQKCRYFNVL